MRPNSGESNLNEGRDNVGASAIPDSVNERPISLLSEYNRHACVCILRTGKSGQPKGLAVGVVSPGRLLEAEFRTSGPLQVPYQISGYTSAWRAKEFFFHSSHAIAPSIWASDQIRV